MTAAILPPGVVVFERGWLSSNNILLTDQYSSALVDSGYCTHADQTVALVKQALGARPLDVLVNTHLHSDHCGGNAALQKVFPQLHTCIPPGLAPHVLNWDPIALTYVPTGQNCPPFRFDSLLVPGAQIPLGGAEWQIHAAKGHDPHSVILFEPKSRLLISADALWENGFGVVFPELEGIAAFEDVAATLDLIESLAPATVIPGHGKIFTHVATSIMAARRRLDSFVSNPVKHGTYAAKVLLKFKLLELQQCELSELVVWSRQTAYFSNLHDCLFRETDFTTWVEYLADDLARSGAALRVGSKLLNA